MMKVIFWHRRDLRLQDNAGLYHALKANKNVQPIFIFDKIILKKLQNKSDSRVNFIFQELERLQQEFKEYGTELWVFYGSPTKVMTSILEHHNIKAVYTNRDYESYALERDKKVKKLLKKNNIELHTYKDHVIFEGNEVLKKDGLPYTVFTPYKKTWMTKLESQMMGKDLFFLKSYPTLKYASHFAKESNPKYRCTLADIGFNPSDIPIPPKSVNQKLIKKYSDRRNFPAMEGTSKLGIHFRFGTISIREKVRKAMALSDTYLSELVWRDFYSQILQNFPHVEKNAFRAKYEKVDWRNNEGEFNAWCRGETGYPIVDAGMRELNNTGHMHNRVRMIVASFLTKHLLIDWRWGEAYFAEKLLDFDLASNNGGWQWAAGCGTDAAPYFRIFNPTTQMEKFDKEKKYIKKWVPEWGTDKYVQPIVDHKLARERCLATYKAALQ